MCGIFGILNHANPTIRYFREMEYQMNHGKNRGPEYSCLKDCHNKIFLGFHRLAINGLNPESHQPLEVDDCLLVCNGEIYNYKQMYSMINISPKTDSDCEIIIHLYKKYGFTHMLEMLDGVFAFILVDKSNNTTYIGRDIFGVRPLFIGNKDKEIGFASEIKMLSPHFENIEPFMPGTYSIYKQSYKNNIFWIPKIINNSYFNGYVVNNLNNDNIVELGDLQKLQNSYCLKIKDALMNAVKKRVQNTDRPIACLLSGGLDSSLITSIVNHVRPNQNKKLETYSIGLEGSEDLKYAKIVANYLGTNHHEIVVSEKTFLDAIPEVIEAIESYDTTTVRASVGNYLVSKYIKKHSKSKVIFNGDGSDEITGGYLYFHKAPDSIEFDKECKRLLKDLHYFDVLRSDRCIASHGLEARTPFLDKNFVTTYLSVPLELRNHNLQNNCEKYLLRKSFENSGFLPNEVLYRTKEAFSDGVSKQTKSWYEIIQEHLEDKKINCYELHEHNQPTTKEQYYYREIFNQKYPNSQYVIPYFWMPKFVNATDSSARTLDIYKKKSNETINEVL